ncbi:hypothetical protein EHE21_11655 [Proteus sp. GOKU]|uniref:hypothetical protein n=1 Tax=Proteus TaxID=583 RepID=UPI001892B6FD|nr:MULTISPECIES: hypothetical protein [Proteus]QPB80003.1 hypothetical protein EHE21_11655 [Proteus sp. GOKU]QQP26010.1 hypothetical protein D7029_11655 [Proteus vulgaris]
MTTVTTNKALVLSGESKNAILTLDEQIVNCIGEDAQIIHTGKKAKIYNLIDEDIERQKEIQKSLFITTGDDAYVETSNDSLVFSAGKNSKVYAKVCFAEESDENNPCKNKSTVIACGENSVVSGYTNDSLVVTTGNDSVITELESSGSGIATGNNSIIEAESIFKNAAIFGNESEINGELYGTAFVGGEDCVANVGNGAILLSVYPLKEVMAGEGSVIVVGWHDGTRKRFSTYYQGIDFEGNIEWITEDPLTGTKTIHYRTNTYITTELGELELTGTYDYERNIS